MNDYIETNRRHWDELVNIHVRSGFYDVASFRAGRSSLLPLERAEVGDVRGKRLLHLQCHFGMDTLSWAREGAIVTGVDFSGEAIATALGLAEELNLEARFIESDVYALPGILNETFDIVFATYGVICWLPDFPRWASIAASFLRPGGVLYLADDHPLSASLAEDATGESPRLVYPYLSGVTRRWEDEGSYADRDATVANKTTYEFTHDLGEIVTALVEAGLRIEFLHEHPFSAWQRVPQMQKGDDGLWRLPAGALPVPFVFSIRAIRTQT